MKRTRMLLIAATAAAGISSIGVGTIHAAPTTFKMGRTPTERSAAQRMAKAAIRDWELDEKSMEHYFHAHPKK